MKKVLVVLLVIGLLLSGAVAITAEEENNFQGVDIADQDLDNGPGDTAPCGGGGAGGGGGSPG